jgi:succinate dehydrogenase / fumarate reductase membrane anchor subunit
MALFTVDPAGQVLFSAGPIGYDKWAGIFAPMDEGADLLRDHGMLWHVWVGMRDIWMDYIKPVGLRLVLHLFTMVWLVGCAGWAIQVLWRL